jgi:hypothetical protein
MHEELRRSAISSEDAFDAAVSALAMDAARDSLSALRREPEYAVEGKIWWPTMPPALPRRDEDDVPTSEPVHALVAGVLRDGMMRGDPPEIQAEAVLAALRSHGALDE